MPIARFTVRTLLQSKLTLALSCILVVLIGVSLGNIFLKNSEADKDIDTLRKEVSSLEENHRRLEEINTFFGTDFFAEKEARLKLGMRKEGEHVVVVQDGDVPRDVREKEEKSTILPSGKEVFVSHDKKSNPIQWWDYFFGE